MKYIVLINPRFSHTSVGPLAHATVHYGIPDASDVIYRGRNLVVRLRGENIVVKAFGMPGVVKGAIYGHMRRSKALRAYSNALRLRAMGIPTPEPYFAGEVRDGLGLLRQSYYACAALDGWSELRGVEKNPDFPEIARALAEFIFNLHTHGVYMADFTPGNVLYRREGGKYLFMLVDINRMEFDVDDWNMLLDNFRAMLDTAEGVAVVGREYAKVLERSNVYHSLGNLDEELVERYRRHTARLLRNRKIKNLFRRKKK